MVKPATTFTSNDYGPVPLLRTGPFHIIQPLYLDCNSVHFDVESINLQLEFAELQEPNHELGAFWINGPALRESSSNPRLL
jgi:hypothetical protein